jgi:hypothetical protein
MAQQPRTLLPAFVAGSYGRAIYEQLGVEFLQPDSGRIF